MKIKWTKSMQVSLDRLMNDLQRVKRLLRKKPEISKQHAG